MYDVGHIRSQVEQVFLLGIGNKGNFRNQTSLNIGLRQELIYLEHKEHRIMVERYFALVNIDYCLTYWTTMPWIRSL